MKKIFIALTLIAALSACDNSVKLSSGYSAALQMSDDLKDCRAYSVSN